MAKQAKAKKVEEVKVEKRAKKPAVVHEHDTSLKAHAMKYAAARFARQEAISKANKSVSAK